MQNIAQRIDCPEVDFSIQCKQTHISVIECLYEIVFTIGIF